MDNQNERDAEIEQFKVRIEVLEQIAERVKNSENDKIDELKRFFRKNFGNADTELESEHVDQSKTEVAKEMEPLKEEIVERLQQLETVFDALMNFKDSFNELIGVIMENVEKQLKKVHSKDDRTEASLRPHSEDFTFSHEIGSGAYGRVSLVRNKTDGHEYALKEIRIDESNGLTEQFVKREIEHLASLKHKNVVTYYGAWCETVKEDASAEDDEDEGDDNSREYKIASNQSGSLDIVFEEENRDDSALEGSSECSIDQEDASVKDDEYSGDSEDEVEDKSAQEGRLEQKETRIMYIQMELCSKINLRTAINSRDWFKDNDRRERFFYEIVEGLSFIHSKGVAHRDLKPLNIFLDSNDTIKIGDFGWSRKVNIDPSDEANSGYSSQTHSFGTSFYLAPEGKSAPHGKPNVTYDQRVDMYSLGIIFFEMYYPFGSGSERIHVLSGLNLREIKLPNDVTRHLNNRQIALVRQLLIHDFKQRPTSSEIKKNAYYQSIKTKISDEHGTMRELAKSQRKLKLNSTRQFVIKRLSDIFTSSYLTRYYVPHQLCSMSTHQYQTLDSDFQIFNSSGVRVPKDLRVAFANHIVDKNLLDLGRYSIETIHMKRPFRKTRKIEECVYDYVAKQSNRIHIPSHLRLFFLLNKIIEGFDIYKGKALTLRLNHVELIRGFLIYSGIDERMLESGVQVIQDCLIQSYKLAHYWNKIASLNKANDKPKINAKINFVRISCSSLLRTKFKTILGSCEVNSLIEILSFEADSVVQLKNHFGRFTAINDKPHHKRGLEIINQAFEEMESILTHLQKYQLYGRFILILSPFMLLRYYSDFIFQLEEPRTEQKVVHDVIALGGRYDGLINKHLPKSIDGSDNKVYALGFSLEIEKLIKLISARRKFKPNGASSKRKPKRAHFISLLFNQLLK